MKKRTQRTENLVSSFRPKYNIGIMGMQAIKRNDCVFFIENL